MKTIITLPNRRQVGLGVYAKAWRDLLSMPPRANVKGWDYFPTPAGAILADMRYGLHDRINRHDRVNYARIVKGCSESRLYTKIKAAALRGAIVYRCRWCDAELDPRKVNPNNHGPRFCGPSCQRSYCS